MGHSVSLLSCEDAALEVGKKVGVDVFDSGTFARIGVDVLRKESITVPDVGTFGAIIIRPLVETEGLFSKKGDIYIWLSDDDQRIPLGSRRSVPIGAVTAELRSRIVENKNAKETRGCCFPVSLP